MRWISNNVFLYFQEKKINSISYYYFYLFSGMKLRLSHTPNTYARFRLNLNVFQAIVWSSFLIIRPGSCRWFHSHFDDCGRWPFRLHPSKPSDLQSEVELMFFRISIWKEWCGAGIRRPKRPLPKSPWSSISSRELRLFCDRIHKDNTIWSTM